MSARAKVAERDRHSCELARVHEDAVLVAADQPGASEHQRAVAEQIREHRAVKGAEHALACTRQHAAAVTPEAIYEQIQATRAPAGPAADATTAERLAYWEACAAVHRRRVELWDAISAALDTQQPIPPLWQYAAVRGANQAAWERQMLAESQVTELRERLTRDGAR